MSSASQQHWYDLAQQIRRWGGELGFQQIGITDIDPGKHKDYLQDWLEKGYHGEMQWMQTHQDKRNQPDTLVSGAQRIICARMDYLPENTQYIKTLKQPDSAYISRYALGRDYHKLIRKRLAKLAGKIACYCSETPAIASNLAQLQQRPFVDSAPVLEKAFAEKSDLGWIGKHTVLINKNAGSWFFLGELFTNLPLPIDNNDAPKNHCGDCTACLKVCPTDAFIAPYKLDARRCISYLTIELKGSIPTEFREPIGNRVFGCDDCQLICPWNKYAKSSQEDDFSPRHQLDKQSLLSLFLWTEKDYLRYTEGSPIRRIGYERWLRNLAVGLGNATPSLDVIAALEQRRHFPSELVQEHVKWALERQNNPRRRKRKIKHPER